jgi:hypothetical protein
MEKRIDMKIMSMEKEDRYEKLISMEKENQSEKL